MTEFILGIIVCVTVFGFFVFVITRTVNKVADAITALSASITATQEAVNGNTGALNDVRNRIHANSQFIQQVLIIMLRGERMTDDEKREKIKELENQIKGD